MYRIEEADDAIVKITVRVYDHQDPDLCLNASLSSLDCVEVICTFTGVTESSMNR